MGRTLRILVVDDSYGHRRSSELLLKHQGHQVVTASHGRAAVRLAEADCWDVILMDLQMPVMNGWQAARAIRRNEVAAGKTAVPIIALTANSALGNRDHCLEAGMDDLLMKPLEPERLVERVRHLARYCGKD